MATVATTSMPYDELEAAPNDELSSHDYELVDELLRELLDDRTPFVFLPEGDLIRGAAGEAHEPHMVPRAPSQQLQPVSPSTHILFRAKPPPRLLTSYSGPTVHDIENALSARFLQAAVGDASGSYSKIRRLESTNPLSPKGGSINRYCLKVRHTGNKSLVPNDGYKWRKYGQKSIKNSPNPRSYYKCANPHCSAKKQVERSPDDPALLLVTYEGLHQHYAFPQDVDFRTTVTRKRPKAAGKQTEQPAARREEAEEVHNRRALDSTSPVESDGRTPPLPLEDGRVKEERHQGSLLQDIVTFLASSPSDTEATTTDTLDYATSGHMATFYSRPSSPHCSPLLPCLSSLPLLPQRLDEGMLFSCFF